MGSAIISNRSVEGKGKTMKNNRNKNNRTRMILALLILVICVLAAVPVFAGTSTERRSSSSGNGNALLNALPPFKFAKHQNGIGYGNCPVYTAPSTDSYRAANGRATVATDGYQVDEAGWVDGWLLVRYQIKTGWRVGYIPQNYVRGFKSSMVPHFGWVPCTADDTIYVTDNVYSHTDSFAVLDPGEGFHVLSRYNYYAKEGYDWWYIECTVDGQVARGFIEVGSPFHADN